MSEEPHQGVEGLEPAAASWSEQLRAELVAAAQREVDEATSGWDRCGRAGRRARRRGAR